ncbi:hypothetical protein CR513_32767, partial [Mucuna pruriens]
MVGLPFRLSRWYAWRLGYCPLPPFSSATTPTESASQWVGFRWRLYPIRGSSPPTRLPTRASEASHFCVDPRPLSLYWREPPKFKGLVRGQFFLEAKFDLQILDSLPRGMNCRDIVSWISTNNATLRLKSMLKKQDVDMAELIKKAWLTNDARSTGRKVPDAATTTAAAAKKKSAVGLAEKDSTLVVEKLTALTVSDKEAGKRKAGSTMVEEATAKKGKTTVLPPPPLSLQPKGKVVVTSGPDLPPGRLSCYVAPPTSNSLWGPGFDA